MIWRHPLSGFLGIPAITRFFKWQILSRIFKRSFVHNWINETKFFVTNGETGLTGNIYVGLHEFNDMGFLLHVLKPGDLFIDIGSNSGSYTILASGAVGAKTISIEPVPSTFLRLIANIKLNAIEALVVAKNIGISSQKGILDVTIDSDTTNHLISTGSSENSVPIQVESLDEVCLGQNPTLIKIDVEGWEKEVLLGARNTLTNSNLLAIILEINGNAEKLGTRDRDLLDNLLEFGFYPYSYDPISRTLSRLMGRNDSTGNTIFIRNPEEVLIRIRIANRQKILGKYL
jgi:FkbM family methyltransferase